MNNIVLLRGRMIGQPKNKSSNLHTQQSILEHLLENHGMHKNHGTQKPWQSQNKI
jgi:hypothetical protein